VTYRPAARRREIWTRLAIDPIAGPFGRWLAGLPGITPNRVTAAAGVTALAAAFCFATGQLRLGGVLFMIRFLLDVVDGVVARAQRTTSRLGAALDVATDVAGIAVNLAALSWYLARHDQLPTAVALLLMAAVVYYNWVLAYRKGIAGSMGAGDGGVMGQVRTSAPVLRGWTALCARLNMSPVPWAVEAETVALGLGPLILPRSLVWTGLAVALAFYLLADLVNTVRVVRLSTAVSEGVPW